MYERTEREKSSSSIESEIDEEKQEQKFKNERELYYGRFSMHNNPDGAYGSYALAV